VKIVGGSRDGQELWLDVDKQYVCIRRCPGSFGWRKSRIGEMYRISKDGRRGYVARYQGEHTEVLTDEEARRRPWVGPPPKTKGVPELMDKLEKEQREKRKK